MRNRKPRALGPSDAGLYVTAAYATDGYRAMIDESQRLARHIERKTVQLSNYLRDGKLDKVPVVLSLLNESQVKRGIILDRIAQAHNAAAMRDRKDRLVARQAP